MSFPPKDRAEFGCIHILQLSVQRGQNIRRIEKFTKRGVNESVPLWRVNLVLALNVEVGSVLLNVGEKVRAVGLGNCRDQCREIVPDILALIVYIPFNPESLVC